MAKVEIEIDDATGAIGTLPEPVQKMFDSKFKEAFGKGAEKSAKEAQAQIAAEVAKARAEVLAIGGDPAAAEKVKNLEQELSKRQEADALRDKNFEEAQRLRDERHAKERAELEKKAQEVSELSQAEIAKRDARLRANVRTDIKAEAVKANTRDASIEEVCELLEKFVGLDDDLQPIVKADEFRKRFTESKLGEDGKAVSIEGLVAEYLAMKPHHKAPVSGKGGGARGGFSISGTGAARGKDAEFEAAMDAVAERPTIASAAAVIGRLRQRQAS